MTIKKTALWALIACAAGVTAGYTVWAQTSGYKSGRTPLVITYEVKDATGRVSHETWHHRSDGSVAYSILSAGDTAAPPTQVVDLVTKRYFMKDPATRLYDELPMSKRLYDSNARTPTACQAAIMASEKCLPLGSDEVLGYRVQKVISVPVNEPTAMVETYLAPDLDYVVLKAVFKKNGNVTGGRNAISVHRREPDASMFALPSDFRPAATPSEFITAMETARGRSNPFTNESRQRFEEDQAKIRAESQARKVQ